MKKPVLAVMAAGMGSRYGGLKQIDPIDAYGHIIMDFSIYDAVRAGFEKVVFIIKKENEALFREAVGDRIARHVEVAYVFQELTNLPDGFSVPEGRVKPWGTGHAVAGCAGVIDGPFAVINADDYYGIEAFQLAYRFLSQQEEADECYQFMMVGYQLENTLTESGYVARGICETDSQGYLRTIRERTHIERHGELVEYTEDEGLTWNEIPAGSTVSMNMWGFTAGMLRELQERFASFLAENLEKNPLKCEYFLPFVVNELLEEKKAVVKVLETPDRWYGMTYKEDKPKVMAAVEEFRRKGLYPEKLWEEV